MVTVNEVIAYGDALQEAIATINHNQVIIDDSQLVKKLSEISTGHNNLLYSVIPSAANQGTDDAVVSDNEMMFLVLKKCDRSIRHDEFLGVMNDTQASALAVQEKMLADKEDSCGFMAWLSESSIKIDPIWGLAGCHGWTITFSMRKNL